MVSWTQCFIIIRSCPFLILYCWSSWAISHTAAHCYRHGNPGDYVWGPGGLDAIITQLLNNVEGAGPPPADADKIDRLPTVKISSVQVGTYLMFHKRNGPFGVVFYDLSVGLLHFVQCWSALW